ncbi:MAG: hypothetical protein WCK89_19805 [bacterium]
MKRLSLFACLFAATFILKGDDAPTLDLVAGWSWWPYYYDRYPYGYGPYGWGYPAVGVGLPLNCGESRYPYGYYGYAPFCGYGYGVRINLTDTRYLPVLSEGLLQPFPGSAPTEPRDPQREKRWDRDLETFLALADNGARQPPATNAPPQTATP